MGRSARYRDYLDRFDDVALGLAPIREDTQFSCGKSFGKALAYLDRKVPVIGSDAIDHRRFFTLTTDVITNDPAEWSAAAERLLGDARSRQNTADAAFNTFTARLSSEAAAARVAAAMTRLVEKDRAATTDEILGYLCPSSA